MTSNPKIGGKAWTINANDLELTAYQRGINGNVDPLNMALRDGRLDEAFLIAKKIEKFADKLMERLNRIKYGS